MSSFASSSVEREGIGSADAPPIVLESDQAAPPGIAFQTAERDRASRPILKIATECDELEPDRRRPLRSKQDAFANGGIAA
jgi:hypothetical protein